MKLETEADLVHTVVGGLRYMGYICQRCNQHRADKSGSDVLPDLFVTHRKWPLGMWLGMEVKTQVGRVGTARRGTASLSQQDLLDVGRILIVRSWQDAVDTLAAFEAQTQMRRLNR